MNPHDYTYRHFLRSTPYAQRRIPFATERDKGDRFVVWGCVILMVAFIAVGAWPR